MEYLILQKQKHEGCDETIGCGINYIFITAKNIEEATEKALYPDGKEEECLLEDDNSFTEILIFQVRKKDFTALNLLMLRLKHFKMLNDEEDKNTEMEERQQLKILQEKYKS